MEGKLASRFLIYHMKSCISVLVEGNKSDVDKEMDYIGTESESYSNDPEHLKYCRVELTDPTLPTLLRICHINDADSRTADSSSNFKFT